MINSPPECYATASIYNILCQPAPRYLQYSTFFSLLTNYLTLVCLLPACLTAICFLSACLNVVFIRLSLSHFSLSSVGLSHYRLSFFSHWAIAVCHLQYMPVSLQFVFCLPLSHRGISSVCPFLLAHCIAIACSLPASLQFAFCLPVSWQFSLLSAFSLSCLLCAMPLKTVCLSTVFFIKMVFCLPVSV